MTAPIKYPTPTSEWGTVTHVAIPNPRWRWWAFWRPRGIVVNIPPRPVKEDESETVKLRRERDKAARDAAWYKERLMNERAANERTVRRLNAQRANVTKLKKRISAGVCPCCTRTFSNLSRHMATQHPDYTEQQEAT